MRIVLLLGLLGFAASAPAPAQSLRDAAPAGPIDVWRACRHPAAFPSDSFALPHDAVPWDGPGPAPRLAADSALRYLCAGLALPHHPRMWYRAAGDWASAIRGRPFALPRARAIRRYSEEVEAALEAWRSARVNAATSRGDCEAPADSGLVTLRQMVVTFERGEADIDAEDSLAIQALARAIEEHLLTYPRDTVLIVGRADATERGAANEALAATRAANILTAVHKIRPSLDWSRILGVARPVRPPTAGAGAACNPERPGAPLDAQKVRYTRHRAALLQVRRAAAGLPVSFAGRAPAADLPAPTRATNGDRASLAVALTDAVIRTAKEQVRDYLFQAIVRRVCDLDGGYARYLPRSCALFHPDSAMLPYRPNLNSLRAAVRSDFEHALPSLIIDSVAPHDAAARWEADELVLAIGIIRYLELLLAGNDPLIAFGMLPDRLPAGVVASTELGRAIAGIAPFLRAYDEAKEVFGEIEATAEHHHRAAELSLRTLAVNLAGPAVVQGGVAPGFLSDLLALAPRLLEAADRVDRVYHETGGASNDSSRARAEQVMVLITLGAEMVLATTPPERVGAAMHQRLRTVAIQVRDMLATIAAHDYRGALLNGIALAATLADREAFCRGQATVPAAVLSKGSPGGEEAGATGPGRCDDGTLLPRDLGRDELRLLAFAAEMAAAEDQATMYGAIYSFLGEGSGYRGKRLGPERQYFTVNAYFGAGFGYELPHASRAAETFQASFSLPIGIEYVWRRGPAQEGSHIFPSCSIFLQLLDLGAVAAYRLSFNDAEAPDPGLRQLVSPGIYGVVGIGDSPFSLGVGAAMSPEAQEYRDDTGAVRTAGATRLALFLAVDVPLFP